MTTDAWSPGARRGLRRSLGWVALALLVAAVAGAWWWFGKKHDSAPRFRFAKVERGALTAVVSSSGTLNAVVTVQVSSQISGQIKELFVDFNSPVKKGQLIARIDPETFDLRVRQAKAEVDAAQTNLLNQRAGLLVLQSQVTRARIALDDARRELERKQSLYARGFVAVADRDKAQFNRDAAAEAMVTTEAQVKVGEAQIANAQAVLRQREAMLAQAQVDLEHTSIRAPVDGVVISRSVDAGQTVAASLSAPTLFTIAQDLVQMQVDTSIDESDIGRIRVDQKATFTVDAFPGRTFEGQVRQIRKAAQTVQNVVTYVVVVATTNADLQLVPGMTANVRIVTESRDNAIKVPNAALRYRPPGVVAGVDAPGTSPLPAAATGKGAGQGADAQGRRQRLVAELKLDSSQQARLDEIFADMRQKLADLRDVPEADRRGRGERIRADVRQRINAMLTTEQRPLYADIVAQETGRTSGAAGGPGRVFVMEPGGKPAEVRIRLGLTDGNATEVLSGDLREGIEVIVGNLDGGGSGAPRPSSGSAPPRLPF